MTTETLAPIPIGKARSNLTEVASEVRHLGTGRVLTNRSTPVAAIVPVGLWEAVQAAGGVSEAMALLKAHVAGNTDGNRATQPA